MRNSSSSVDSWIIISGSAVTICCSAGKLWFCLNSKSPSARDRARLPGESEKGGKKERKGKACNGSASTSSHKAL